MNEKDSYYNELKYGEELFSGGSFKAAEAIFLRLAKENNYSKEALNNLGVIAYQEGRSEEAVDFFIKSLNIDPSYDDAIANLNLYELNDCAKRKTKESGGEIAADGLSSGRTPVLAKAKLAIVNFWDNKFTDLYVEYFSRKNQVKKIKPQNERDLKEILDWADIIWSQWCNEHLVYLSRQRMDAALITHIHSYEILTPPLMQNVAWDRMDGAIFVADHIRNNANRLWNKQLCHVSQTTIFNSVNLSEYPLYKGYSGKNIGYIGYINHKKGMGLLLQCFKAAVDVDPGYRLHIAGTFQETRFEVYMTHLMKQMDLEDKVVMHGWVNDIPGWLKAMQYVVSTSPWEGCPLNIIEAMACGIKPLVHNWQGAKDLFPPENVFTTVDEFVRLLTSSEYDSLSYRSHIEEHFNADKNVPKIEAYIRSVLDRRRVDYSRPLPPQGIRKDETKQSVVPNLNKKGPDSINFFQPLARSVELSTNRKAFTVNYCRGKRVLHVGCVDSGLMDSRIQNNNFLHYQLKQVATEIIGVDIDEAGLERLASEGYAVDKLNLETDREKLAELAGRVDVIVIPEVIEHLNNVGSALDNLKASRFCGEILISTPNAFSFRVFKMLANCIEFVHPNHNYYYSPNTLKTLLEKHGLILERLVMYYWLTNDDVGRELQQVVMQCPYYAEGIIGIIRDSEFRDAEFI